METVQLTQEISQLHANICSALADPRRILILYLLSETQMNVGDLSDAIGESQPTTSRHLKILRERDLVHAKRQGATVFYHLSDSRLIEALDLLRSVLCDHISHRASLIQNE